uniref:Tox-GHH domain-containing protein n=1 Tax=Macrostomum lignano TaxID=282301 RepID=A0A1I8JFC7_9PLAT
PSTIDNPLGGRFHFACDSSGGLMSLGTPDGRLHRFLANWGLATNRILYWPCKDCVNPFVFHYESGDYLQSLHYPSQLRRLSFALTADRRVRRVVSDQAYTEIAYSSDNSRLPSALRTVYFDETNTNVSQRYDYTGGLLRKQVITFDCAGDDQLAKASYVYRYDTELRIAGIETVITSRDGQPVTSLANVTRDPIGGGVTLLNDLSLERRVSHHEHLVRLRDSHCTRRFQFDSLARLTESTLHCGSDSRRAFVLSVHGHSRGRLQKQVYHIGESDGLSVAYQTNKLGLVVRATAASAAVAGSPVRTTADEALEYTLGGRIHWRSIRSSSVGALERLNYTYDSRTGLPKSVGSVQYSFDADGFLAMRRHRLSAGSVENFRYDAKGLVRRAEAIDSSGRRLYSLRYVYDAQERLLARIDRLHPQKSTQFLYADPEYPRRVTHILPGAGRFEQSVLTCRYEDRTGQLVAVETGEPQKIERFYVVSDYFSSPLALLNQRGEIETQLSYSATGERSVVSKRPTAPSLPFGYRLGLQDPDAGLVWLSGSRTYDPYLGQWTGPDPLGLFTRLSAALQTPESIDGYIFDHLSTTENGPLVSNYEEVSRPEYWLKAFNIDAKRLLRATNIVSMGIGREAEEGLLPRLHQSPLSPKSVSVESIFEAGFRRRLDSFQRIIGAFDFVQPSSAPVAPPLASAPAFLYLGLRPTFSVDGKISLTGWEDNSLASPDRVRQLAALVFNGSRLLPQQAETMANGHRWLRLYREATPATESAVRDLEQSIAPAGAASISIKRDGDDSLEVRVDSGLLSASLRCSRLSFETEANQLATAGLRMVAKRLMRAEAASITADGYAATRFDWSRVAQQELRQNGIAAGYRPATAGKNHDQLLWDDPGSVYFVPTA